jgi:chromosomal replication initiation ATPase DnaA
MSEFLTSMWKGPLEVRAGHAVSAYAEKKLTWRQVIQQVAEKHNLTVDQVISPDRHRHIVIARHEAMWRLRQETKMSLPQIARALGRTDHTTVRWAINRHAERMAEA